MKIIVKNSHIEVHDYEMGSCPDIEREFSYFDLITHVRIPLGMYYDGSTNILYLPRGIDIWWLEKKLDCPKELDDSHDSIRCLDSLNLLTQPRDDSQKEALRFMVSAGEYRKFAANSQLHLNLNTGKGKTYISIATIAYYQVATILIMYSNSYITQWKERILEYTDLKSKDVKIISGSAAIHRLLNKKENTEKIYLVTHATLQRFGTENGWHRIGELFNHLGIGIKIYDEAHQNFLNITMIDFFTNTKRTYYVTASPAKSSEEENRIYAMYFKNVPAISLFDEDNDPHTRYFAIKYNSNPTIYDIHDCKNQYGLDNNKYASYLVEKPEYYELLRVILNIALKNDGKCLIYIATNKAILKTYTWIIDNYPELYGDVGIFTTIVSPEEKEEAKNKKIILSTTKSAGAAVDIYNLKMTVVLNEPFKSSVITQQTIGRTRDSDTLYIECVDMGFKQIPRYYEYKKPTVAKYCTDTNLIRLNRAELSNRSDKIKTERGCPELVEMIGEPVSLVSWLED